MSRIALVAGGTGLVGGHLLRLLVNRADYAQVRVLGRRPPPLEHGKLRFVSSDFANLAEIPAELAADDVFCCLGTTIRDAGSEAAFERVDYHMVVDLARAAKKAGAKRFLVVSAAGSSLKSPAFYSRLKARMEKAVADVGFDTTHIVRPSLLLGSRRGQRRRPGELIAQKLAPFYAPFMAGPLRKYAPVRAETVAEALVTLALRDGHGVQVHHLPLG